MPFEREVCRGHDRDRRAQALGGGLSGRRARPRAGPARVRKRAARALGAARLGGRVCAWRASLRDRKQRLDRTRDRLLSARRRRADRRRPRLADRPAAAPAARWRQERPARRARDRPGDRPRRALATSAARLARARPELLCDYRRQLLAERTRTANRLHVDLVSLRPGYERAVPRLDSPARLAAAQQLLAGETALHAQLARRRLQTLHRLDAEIKQLEREIKQRVDATGSGLPRLVGISYLGAASIIGGVGDVRRIASKARFARLNGTAPIPASSGQTQRHRLNKGGNRRLNHTLHMMALTQARHDPRARAYLDRRRAEGRTRRDALRALKRQLSDAVYQQLRQDAGLRSPALT